VKSYVFGGEITTDPAGYILFFETLIPLFVSTSDSLISRFGRLEPGLQVKEPTGIYAGD